MRRRLTLVLALVMLSCRLDRIEPVAGLLAVEPASLEFGAVPLGVSEVLPLTLLNTGRVPLTVMLSVNEPAVQTTQTELTLAPGTTSVDVSWTVSALGPLRAQVSLTTDVAGLAPLSVEVDGTGIEPPACPPTSACTTAQFSVTARACVEVPVADGTACSSPNVCLVGTACLGGRCLGATRSCDDGNACTVDSCSPARGCESFPRGPCPSDGVCGVGVCDPRLGCQLRPASDGTPCGPLRTCVAADVCLSGECVVRRPPEGFVCTERSPCRDEGRCVAATCVIGGVERLLRPTWQAGAPRADGGRDSWSDVLVDGDGGYVLSSYFMSPPRLDAAGTPFMPASGARRCVVWRDWLVCGDHPSGANAPAAAVTAMHSKTGAVAWTYADAPTDLPVLFAPRRQTFLARLLVQSNERLVVLFESQLIGADIDRCRRFGLVLLDETGHSRGARSVDDAVFDICTHPHSYGAAVDSSGNLYLAFSPSLTDNPATPTAGTWLVSYSAALAQRWTATEPSLVAGELAVGRGLLFAEYDSRVRSTSTGASIAQLARPFGLGAVSSAGVVTVSDAGISVVSPSLAPLWTSSLPWRSPPKLANWMTPAGARTVVLGVVDEVTPRLVALDGTHGAEIFSCPLELDAGVINVEVGFGSVGVMFGLEAAAGATTCETCDPRWARTSCRFAGLPTPGISPSSEPWPGVWGGSGHGHREQ